MLCRRKRRGARGTSLVEAMVAMAIMAFGMLAVLGIQATLRLNADVAKQRSEAVRIAQEALEGARAFATIDSTAGQVAYADVVDIAGVAVTGYTTNTQYSLSREVSSRTAPDHKEVRVRVAWVDRTGEAQGIELSSVIGANDPRVARALGAQPKGIPVRQPHGRHPAIPPLAKSMGDGRSAFKPPSADALVVWVFNDQSGLIVGVCNTVTTGQAELTAADISACSDNTTAQPLSGFVRFATAAIQPGAADAENPTDNALNLAVSLALTSAGHPAPGHICFAAAPGSSTAAALLRVVPYYCAIFANPSRLWSGLSTIAPLGFSDAGNVPWALAVDAADASASRYRVCRYTPAVDDAASVPNRLHPRLYANVVEPLRDQNFLVIRAGDGSVAFVCPTDVPANPETGDLVNSHTLVHQPAP